MVGEEGEDVFNTERQEIKEPIPEGMSLRSTEEGGGFVWTKWVLLELATGLWHQGSLVKCRRIGVTFNGSLNNSTIISREPQTVYVKDLVSCPPGINLNI